MLGGRGRRQSRRGTTGCCWFRGRPRLLGFYYYYYEHHHLYIQIRTSSPSSIFILQPTISLPSPAAARFLFQVPAREAVAPTKEFGAPLGFPPLPFLVSSHGCALSTACRRGMWNAGVTIPLLRILFRGAEGGMAALAATAGKILEGRIFIVILSSWSFSRPLTWIQFGLLRFFFRPPFRINSAAQVLHRMAFCQQQGRGNVDTG